MDIFLDKHALLRALRRIQGAAANVAGAHSIYVYVRLRTLDNELELVAMNGIVTATTRVDAHVVRAGTICVQLKLFRDAAELLQDGEIRLELGMTDRFRLSSGGRSIALTGRSAADYPLLPEPPRRLHNIPTSALRFLLKRTTHAAGTNPEQPERCAIHVERVGPSLVAFAMDGQRAAEARMPSPPSTASMTKLVLHHLAASEALRLLDDEPPDILKIGETDRHIFIEAHPSVVAVTTLHSASVDRPGELNVNHPTTARLSRTTLVNAVGAAKRLTHSEVIKLVVRASGVTVQSDPQVQHTSTQDYVEGEVEGALVQICMNGNHLTEALHALEAKDVLLGFGRDSQAAISLRPVDEDEVSMIFMPIIIHS